jgi:hypothetical protein
MALMTTRSASGATFDPEVLAAMIWTPRAFGGECVLGY